MLLSCQTSECSSKTTFAYECGMNYCTKSQIICQRFLMENSIIHSITKSFQRSKNSFADEKIEKCSSGSIRLNLGKICTKEFNCAVPKFFTTTNFLIAFNRPVSCACNAANSYDCDGEFCTRNADECRIMLALNDRRTFIFSKIEKCK